MPFKTQYNAPLFPTRGEVNNLPSATVPDQSLTIRQILDRYSRGLPLSGQKVPIYSDNPEDDLPDPRTLDLADMQELAEYGKLKLSEVKNLLKEKQEKERKRELDAEIERELEKRLKARETALKSPQDPV